MQTTQHTTPARQRGITLVELIAGVAIAGILAGTAYPMLQSQLQKGRRVDALVTAMTLQLAQERHRSNHNAYADLAELGVAARTPGGHYLISITDAGADGYTLHATATGAQANDRGCRHLRLVVDGSTVARASGADAGVANDSAANRRCWSQ